MAQDYFPDIALVSELGIRKAIVYAYRTLGLTIEASAAVALAALLEGAAAAAQPPRGPDHHRRQHRARPARSAADRRRHLSVD